MSESFNNLSYICFLILCVQNLSCKAFEPIFTKELVFDLYVEHIFHGVKFFWIQTARWTKWDGAIKPFHIPFWVIQLDSYFGKKVCTQDYVVFDIVIIKHKNLLLIDVPIFIKLGQSEVFHHDDFLSFKVTCKGPHMFGITKQLSDNAFWKA